MIGEGVMAYCFEDRSLKWPVKNSTIEIDGRRVENIKEWMPIKLEKQDRTEDDIDVGEASRLAITVMHPDD